MTASKIPEPGKFRSRRLLAPFAIAGAFALATTVTFPASEQLAVAQTTIYNIGACGAEPKNQNVTNKDGCTCAQWRHVRCCVRYGTEPKETVDPKTGKKKTEYVKACIQDSFRHVCQQWHRPPCRTP